MNKALEYGYKSCETMMRKFEAEELPPKHHFHYHQGVFLSGMQNLYKITGDKKLYNYIKRWVNLCIDSEGNINIFDENMLDDIQPGILLFDLYREEKDERYTKALKKLIGKLENWKRNQYGGFWHKEYHPNQMWLDSLYMAGPIQALYGKEFLRPDLIENAAEQSIIMHEHMYDEKSGLYIHAWDASKEIDWADKETGKSEEVWGRALGWYAVANLDIMECMDKSSGLYQKLSDIENRLLKAICKYQASDGRWYQVVDKVNESDNWLETSCSCLFTYAIAKAVRMGVLEKEYHKIADFAFDGIVNSLKTEGENLIINNVCIGTSVCNYDEYIKRPTCENDLHGVGAFLLMCAELARDAAQNVKK